MKKNGTQKLKNTKKKFYQKGNKSEKFLRLCLAAVIAAIVVVAILASVIISMSKGNEEETTLPEDEEIVEIPGGSLSVPYISSDSLNPYFAETLHNCALTSLIYRSLYTLGNAPLCENLHFAPACHPPKRIHRSWALHMRIYLIF